MGNGLAFLRSRLNAVEQCRVAGVRGRVAALSGLTIEATDLSVPVGGLCRIGGGGGGGMGGCLAEVIGFAPGRTLLMPLESTAGISEGMSVESVAGGSRVWCSMRLLGKVLDGLGRPVGGGGGGSGEEEGALPMGEPRPLRAKPIAALERTNIREPICTSVRSIDAVLTCGLGQRMGIFSGPGVGKSTIMSQIARHTSADVSVVALIGERGREVQEFIHNALGEEGLKKCVMVVSTGDESPLMRVRAAWVATTVAEYFRDQGLHVMLMMDSLTRLAQAQRQIGLAAKEPPATKGYPPSVFALIPELLERAGKGAVGSVTGFYTVLVEGDDFNEPIPDCVKGITDGHILLSRHLANRGHFPAIDVLQSISRVRGDVCGPEQVKMARRVQGLLATYQQIEDLVNIGAYVKGSNPEYDLAIEAEKRITAFLKQDSGDPVTLAGAVKQLGELINWIDQLDKAMKAQQAGKKQVSGNIARTA